VIELGENRYGKSSIRLVKVDRAHVGHRVRDLTVAVSLEGTFEAAHVQGDNALVIATDTMKNTTYALAKDHLNGPVEEFAGALAEHFLEFEQVECATVTAHEHAWQPIPVPSGPAPDAFVRDTSYTRLATVEARREGATTRGGLEDLTLLKTTRSAFAGFPRDRFTTLPETNDRLMATRISARWRYARAGSAMDFDGMFESVRRTLLEVFAQHESASVQASAWIIGRAILERHPAIDEVSMTLPNLHHWQVDLSPFGIANDAEIFVATAEPHGLIEATVRRGTSGVVQG
jgi:urate oxidase